MFENCDKSMSNRSRNLYSVIIGSFPFVSHLRADAKLLKKFNPQDMIFFVVGQETTDAAIMAWASAYDHPIIHYERPGVDPISDALHRRNS